MLRLITFGGLSLTFGETTLRNHTSRQRLLPMLAILAAEGARGMSRDKLAPLLWPDSEPQKARHSLDELVLQARKLGRIAGCDDVFARAPSLVLDRQTIETDLWEFDAAMRNNELDRAVAICADGRFAADVSIDGCAELEGRLAAIAVRQAREHKDALTRLARRAADLGDSEAEVRWTQRIIDLDPSDRRATLALVDALAAQREIVTALAVAERYWNYLRDLELEPDMEVVQRIRRLRATSPTPARDDHPTVLTTVTAGPETAEQLDRARLDRVIAPRWRIAGAGVRGSFVVSYPGYKTEPPRGPVEIYAIPAAIAHRANPGRFAQTLQRSAGLQHARVLPILDWGLHEGLAYFVSPPRGSTSLKSRLAAEHHLPIRDAITIARALAIALAHAHERGVVHGDLRPKHVHLRGPCDPVVGFFGVVDAIAGEPRPGDDGSYAVLFGEKAYKSPEQLRHTVNSSARSDVYAFGAIVYEMLAGRPFAPVDVARHPVAAPASLRSLRDSVPEALERIVHTCLAAIPADRYESGVALAEAMTPLTP